MEVEIKSVIVEELTAYAKIEIPTEWYGTAKINFNLKDVGNFNEVDDLISDIKRKLIRRSYEKEMLEMLEDVKDYLGSDVREKVEQLIKSATDL